MMTPVLNSQDCKISKSQRYTLITVDAYLNKDEDAVTSVNSVNI